MKKKININYFDNHIIVAYKPANVLSQKDRTGDESILEMVKEFIAKEFDKKGKVFLGSVHRLDRPAEGLIVFAKTSKALERLNKAFQEGAVEKFYYAIVEGVPAKDKGELMDYLWKDKKHNFVKRYKGPGKDRKKALLSYEVVAHKKQYSLMKIKLQTGRPHQIRVQLAGIGCPIVGDLKYGSNKETGDLSICLQSFHLAFTHPVKKERMEFKAKMPEKKFWKLFSDIELS